MTFTFFHERLKSRLAGIIDPTMRRGLPLQGLDATASLQTLLADRRSLIRWGDGESIIAMGGNLPFQKNTPELRERMINVLRYSQVDEFHFALPWRYLVKSIDEEMTGTWRHTRYVVNRYYPMNITCLDAHLFRNQRKAGVVRLPDTEVERLWTRFSRAIVVAGKNEFLARFREDYPELECLPVTVPVRHAWAEYPAIAQQIGELVGDRAQDTCLLAACGPCAKILVADFASTLTCYDIGHYLAHRYSQD